MLNRWVLSRDRKPATEGAEVTRSGRLFQQYSSCSSTEKLARVDINRSKASTTNNMIAYIPAVTKARENMQTDLVEDTS